MGDPGDIQEPAQPALLRELNERTVLDVVRHLRSVSRAEVARRTGLSKPTVSLALRTLEASGLVRPVGHETGRPGRAGVLYEPIADAAIAAGVEVTVGGVRAVAVDLDGTVLVEAAERHDGSTATAEAIFDSVASCIRSMERWVGRSFSSIVLGTPGVVDPVTGVLTHVGTIDALEGTAPAAAILQRTGRPVSVLNDVDLVALGEQAEGHGRDVDDFAVLWIGSGLGSALVLGGRLHVGHHGIAGEIAEVPFARAVRSLSVGASVDGPEDGAHEFVEHGVDAHGVAALAERLGRRAPRDADHLELATGVLDDALLQGAVGAAVLAELARWTSWYVTTLAALLDPELVVLAGPIGSHDALRPAVEGHVAEQLAVPPRLESSKLGHRSVLAGAGAVARRDAAESAFAGRVLDREAQGRVTGQPREPVRHGDHEPQRRTGP